METFYIEKITELKKLLPVLEKKLNIKISLTGKKVSLEGSPLSEYEASLVFNAIAFGFPPKKAIALKDEEIIFKTIHIKSHTKRNLKSILSRLIGKKGKTRKIISEISGCEILIRDAEVGILGPYENVQDAETALLGIIRGSKQTNIYYYLEKMNMKRKKNYYKRA